MAGLSKTFLAKLALLTEEKNLNPVDVKERLGLWGGLKVKSVWERGFWFRMLKLKLGDQGGFGFGWWEITNSNVRRDIRKFWWAWNSPEALARVQRRVNEGKGKRDFNFGIYMLQYFQFRYSTAFGFFHLRFFHLIATVFTAISFQFQQNKFYPNRPQGSHQIASEWHQTASPRDPKSFQSLCCYNLVGSTI